MSCKKIKILYGEITFGISLYTTGNFKYNKKTDIHKTQKPDYYDNVFYINGEKNHISEVRKNNNSVISKCYYIKNICNGLHINYDYNEKIKCVNYVVNDLLNGYSTYYDNTRMTEEYYYIDEIIVMKREYDESGIIIKIGYDL